MHVPTSKKSLSVICLRNQCEYETLVCLSVCLPFCLSIYLPIYLSICLPAYLSVCLSVYLSTCLLGWPIFTSGKFWWEYIFAHPLI